MPQLLSGSRKQPSDTEKQNQELKRLLRIARTALIGKRKRMAETYNRPDVWPNQTSVPGVTNSYDKPNQQSQFDLSRCHQVMADAGIADGDFIRETCRRKT